MKTLSAATLAGMVGVDTYGVLRARVVYATGVLTHPADASLYERTVLIDVADHYRVDRESQEIDKSKAQVVQLSQERVHINIHNCTTAYVHKFKGNHFKPRL